MAQPQLLQIKLSRFDAQPWGFRLQGGVDFASPLVVQKVNGGSLAEKAGLIPGDAVLQINDVDVFNLRHKDAQDVVVRSGNNFVLTVQRGGSTWRPHVTPTGNLPQPQQNSPYLQTVTKTSLAHKQQEGQHIGCGYNNAARPFVNGGDGSVKSIVNKQYNTPVGIYSDESIAETLSAQAEVLAGGVLGVNFKKNEKEYQPDKSEVLKFLREEETGQSTPAFQQDYQHQHQNQHQHLHHQQQQPQQQQQQQQHYQPSATRHVSAPVNSSKPPSTGGLPTGQNICHECERLITGVFVRIKDKNLHVECFKCATCGTSLKNQGYYNYNNKLYCDIHAKLAALQNPPPGTDGYVPVPIKPNAKLSANTISSALNAHGFSDIPVANGGVATQNSVPRPQAYESANENKEDNTDLPLPPPPSPSLLQQLEIDSQYCAAVDDNTTDTKQKLLHISRHSTLSTSSNNSSRTSAAQPSHIPSMTEEISTAPMVDETSSGYTSASSLRSRQTSSAPSSVCGTSTDSNRTPIASPPPPPPLPPSLPVQMIQQPHRQPCENDMNSQNQHGIGGGLAGGVYSKFLKEYSNKLLTQNNKNNISTNSLSIDISSKSNHKHYEKSNKSLVTNNIQNRLNNTALPYHPSTQTLMTSHAQSVKNLDSIASGLISTTTDAVPGIDTASATTKNTHPSVIAISANFTNQLNPCQQVAKSATDSTLPPPALLSSTPKTEITSATLINAVNSNCHSHISNRCESAQLSEFEGIPDTAREATSAMLANQPSELDQSPFGEYVTLTGSVIRSVVPPGKGTNINYKVHQGYARPFGAASGAPASAPKSPVAYPPQRSAVNPYATLPRNNVGQQGRRINTYNKYSTQFRKPITTSYGSNKYATMPVYNSSQYNNGYYNQGVGGKGAFGATSAPKRGRGIFNKAVGPGVRVPLCNSCNIQIRGPFITALGRIWCPEHFICVNANCRRPLQDIGFVEEKGDLYCEYCFEKYLAPTCSKCGGKIKGDCLNAIGKQFHPECFTCGHCGKLFGNTPFFLEDGNAYCEADWNELFTTKCFACGFPVEAGDRWVEALNHNYHSQCFNCTYCKQNLEGQSFYNKGGRPFCKNHAR
ncbi:PDZ and LIM domain protein Zasp isoform X8 [Rhagoletis pomonella]|uniref:PDZ and LIM domain protein Zasp isoform X8 n=1 Tax=Rhagoletis pomonella TaxID=28610 RepID=UPI0017813CD9|nr:PDZ and LIM domain protein Zasp isoform X8 [Rhagoletis pomonella]